MIIDKVSTKSQIKCHADQIFSKLRPKCILWLEKISNEEFLNCIEALVYKLKAYFLAWRYFNEIHTVDPLECLLCIAKIWNLKLFPVRNYFFFLERALNEKTPTCPSALTKCGQKSILNAIWVKFSECADLRPFYRWTKFHVKPDTELKTVIF